MRTYKTDAKIQQDVINELAWDTRVECTDVGVEVNNCVVTLTGTVSSWAEKLAAEDAAHRVAAVHDVANDLVVKLPRSAERSDTDIAAAIRQALIWDVLVPEDRIHTTVSNGFVTLRGEVDVASQRHDAARAIGNIVGVRAIDNQITIRRTQVTMDALESAIRSALERHVDREASRIEVEVDKNDVTLRGTVDSWAERQAVLGAARGTRGVGHVIDRLHVALPMAH